GSASKNLISYSYLASIIGALATSIIFLLGLGLWSPALRVLVQDPGMTGWFIFGTVIWGVFALQDSALTALRQAVWVPLENALYAAAKIILLIVLAVSFSQYGIFASWTLPLAFAVIAINFAIFKWIIPAHVRGVGARVVPIVPREIYKYVSGNYL